MNRFKSETSQGKQINIQVNQIQKQTTKAKLTVDSWMRDIFEAIYGSIVVNHASLPVKGKGFSVLAATGLEKATGEIYRTLSRKPVDTCNKEPIRSSTVCNRSWYKRPYGWTNKSHLHEELWKYYHELWIAMLQTVADKFKYALYCSSSGKLVQSHIAKTQIDTADYSYLSRQWIKSTFFVKL